MTLTVKVLINRAEIIELQLHNLGPSEIPGYAVYGTVGGFRILHNPDHGAAVLAAALLNEYQRDQKRRGRWVGREGFGLE